MIQAITVLCLVPALSTATAVAVHAESAVPPIAKTNPHAPRALIDRLPSHIKNDPTYVIDPAVKADTPLIYVDGSPVAGQSAGQVAAAASCWKSLVVPGWQTDFGSAVEGNCAFIGTTKSTKKTYNFKRNPSSSGNACFQVRGYWDPVVTPAGIRVLRGTPPAATLAPRTQLSRGATWLGCPRSRARSQVSWSAGRASSARALGAGVVAASDGSRITEAERTRPRRLGQPSPGGPSILA